MTTEMKRARHRGALAWMAHNPVAANLLMLLLLVGGLLWAMRIKQEVHPEFSTDLVTVTVPYPGAGPEEVEQGIILALEEAVRGLDGIKEVTATAREGAGIVTAELLVGVDNQELAQEIKQEVDRITSFPEEAEEAQVVLVSGRHQVMFLVLSGEHDEGVLREVAEQVRDRLLQSKGITQTELSATRPFEISIEISRDDLRAYGLTLGRVADKLRRAAVELPGGGIKTEGGEILVRMKERRDYGRQFAEIPIVTGSDGTRVLLGDVAEIRDGFADTDEFAMFDGKPAIMINVYRVGDQTPIGVSDAVKEIMEEVRVELPPGVELDILFDMSDIYRQRVELLLRNGRIGLVLVFVLLAVFLEMRLAFWVTMGIPISFLGAFLLLPLVGVSINMVSLFAFIIALGIVVDDAIVVGENIYEHHQRGVPFLRAAVRGTREVAMPVTFSVLTNIAAFMPLFFIPGIMGKFFRAIPAVVVIVFSISLIECLFVLPAHLGHGRERRLWLSRWVHGYQRRFSDWFAGAIRTVYGPFLRGALRRRYMTVAVGAAVLALTVGYVASGRMGMVLFPKIESDFAVATAVLPYGTSVEATKRVRDRLLAGAEEIAARHGRDELVRGIFAHIGGAGFGGRRGGGVAGSNVCNMQVFLRSPKVRPIGAAQFVKEWRQRVGAVSGLESLVLQSDLGGPGAGASLTVELRHRSVAVLERAAADLAGELGRFSKVKDIDDGFSPGKQQFDFRMLPAGRSLGLTSIEVARQVRNAFYGAEVLRQQRGRNEVKVMVRLPEAERVSEYDLEELLVRTPAGRDVPLREVVKVERGRAYTSITRRDGRRTVSVTADVDPRKESGQVLAALKAGALPALCRKYPGLDYGFEGRQADMAESLSSLSMGFALTMLLIYGLLAVPFRSYIQPFIIMVSIPFGIVGAVIGHLIMGYSLSVMSMMGIVALAGVVVNDSLILINFANGERRAGKSAREAVTAAGVRRFRPIMLTTLTTFGGLAPMIFETSMQARFLIPMALSLGYGILFATGITLLLVPCLYVMVEDLRGLFGVDLSQPEAEALEGAAPAAADAGT